MVWDRPDLLALAPPGTAVTPFDVPAPRLSEAGSAFELDGVEVVLGVPGAHNARNAAAALTACRLAGADLAEAAAALRDFSGAGRRFERLGTTASGALVVDDYAHHPTEVQATIEAARTLGPRRARRRLPAAPLLAHPPPGARVRRRARRRRRRRRARHLPGPRARRGLPGRHRPPRRRRGRRPRRRPPRRLAPRLRRGRAPPAPTLRDGDVLLTLGAGNVDALGRRLLTPKGPGPLLQFDA